MLSYWERCWNSVIYGFFERVASSVAGKLAIGVALLVVVFFAGYFGTRLVPQPGQPLVMQTYVSDKYGFSFKYSQNFKVEEVGLDEDGWIVVEPVSATGTQQAIIISTRLNDPPISAVDWLNGPDSGYDASQGHLARYIGGQPAVSVEESSWVVVNSPDDEERVSIALLGKDGPIPLQSEMETILVSFSFDITMDPASLQCPSYYLTKSLKEQSLLVFLYTFATTTDDTRFISARMDFYIAHDCIDALELYGYDGYETINLKVRQRLINNMVESVKNAR